MPLRCKDIAALNGFFMGKGWNSVPMPNGQGFVVNIGRMIVNVFHTTTVNFQGVVCVETKRMIEDQIHVINQIG